jgi:hypothetical protein
VILLLAPFGRGSRSRCGRNPRDSRPPLPRFMVTTSEALTPPRWCPSPLRRCLGPSLPSRSRPSSPSCPAASACPLIIIGVASKPFAPPTPMPTPLLVAGHGHLLRFYGLRTDMMHVPTRKFLLTRRMPILPTLRTLLAATALARLEARPRGTRLASLPRVWALPTPWTSRQECSRVATMLLLRDADCQSQYTANAHAREREVDRRCHDHHRATRARGWRPRSGPCVPCTCSTTRKSSPTTGVQG